MAEPAFRLTLPDRDDGRTWPAQGEWTYEDYLRLPDDGRRYEVIHGHLHWTPASGYDHQFAVVRCLAAMDGFVSPRGLGIVLAGPFDILLPRGIGSPVEPDLIFFRTGNQPRRGDKSFLGIPDLVLEVLSPGTQQRDRGVKFKAYQEAKVPEYWMIDPDARTAVVHTLEGGRFYRELCRGGMGETVGSAVLPGFRLSVGGLFPA